MVMRTVDIASIQCRSCGHISTPPDAVNPISYQMDQYKPAQGTPISDIITNLQQNGNASATTTSTLIQMLSQKHKGNTFVISGNAVTVDRSYCEVQLQSSTQLSESDHIILGCPQCHDVLYEVKWRSG